MSEEEEYLRLASADNLRDVAGPGYATRDGGRVRTGVFYRSNDLRLTDADGTRMLATDAQANGARSYWGLGHALLIDDFYARLDDPEPFWLTPDVGLGALRVLRTTYAQSGLLPDGTPL